MNLKNFQTAIADKLRSVPELAAVPVREEDLGNIIETLKTDLAKDSMCIIVGLGDFKDEAPDSTVCYGEARVTVSVVEDPEMNRRKPGRATALLAAQSVANALKLFRPEVDGAGYLTSPTVSSPAETGNFISITVSFITKIQL